MDCLRVELLAPEFLPERAHYGDGGLDCRSTRDVTIYPGSAELIDLGFKIEIPYGYAGFLFSRSGHSKVHVSLANGVGLIDHQYRGWVMARLENRGCNEIILKKGDRIAQLAVVPIALFDILIVDRVNNTARGSGGFGSTGTL